MASLPTRWTGGAVADATVTVLSGGLPQLTTSTREMGELFGELPSGAYDVEISAPGYQAQVAYGVVIFEGQVSEANFNLIPLDAPYLWDNVSADARVGTVDSSLMLQYKVGLIVTS